LSPLLAGRLRGGASGESSVDLEATSSVVSSDESSDESHATASDDGNSEGEVGSSARTAGALEELTKDIAYLNTERPRPPPPPRRRPEEEESETESEDDEKERSKREASAAAIAEAKEARLERKQAADKLKSKDKLRSPILCVLGHVDTGKTKLLDKIRRTNVQEGEAGGITQQIGATFFPIDALRQGWRIDEMSTAAGCSQGGEGGGGGGRGARTAKKTATGGEGGGGGCEGGAAGGGRGGEEGGGGGLKYRIPGLLVIDTPGHESFSNLRSRGASLCDICVLVVDLVHGLEPQTIESLQLLKSKRCPFIVALNKVDRCYGWKGCPDSPIRAALAHQPEHTVRELNDRWRAIQGEIAAQGLNADLFYENTDPRRVVSVVPTSAISGEGVPDLLRLAVELTQTMLEKRLMLSPALEATVLEVKVMEGLGTTLDVVLVHGELREGDEIVVCGLTGAITTTVRSLLTPHPMREMRVKNEFVHHKAIAAAMGVRISAPGLEGAVAGTPLLRREKEDSLEELKSTVMEDLREVMSDISTSGKGVHVQASTLGALEALMDFLRNSSIPVASINIGPVHKKDVIRAGTMVEKSPDLALILAFDVKIVPEASELAKQMGVTIFSADIIYHLFDKFTRHIKEKAALKRKDLSSKGMAVFPAILNIIPGNVFNKKNPIILGADVIEGSLRIGTPLCIPELNFLEIGKVTSIQNNHKEVKVCVPP
jgi:translation initiation factor 5B